ncbi:helix-turn-helix domain-containing protein [Lagierella sp.]|uniref:helix-turn-helix domain-containing protein n=1 Tax=Lagierella sp. TaxID=2849657 RepID=UPI00262FC7D7|nr:helix-turn-helix domain-containing protein [Lagierella sp.]
MLLNQLTHIDELKIIDSNILKNEDIYLTSTSNLVNNNVLSIIEEEEIIKLNPKEGNFFVLNSTGKFNSLEKINVLFSSIESQVEALKTLQNILTNNFKFTEKIYTVISQDLGLEKLLTTIGDQFKDKVCLLDSNKKLLYNPYDFNKVSQLFPLKYISATSSRLFAYLAFENNHDEEKNIIDYLNSIISNYVYREMKKLQTSYDSFYDSLKGLLNKDFSDEDFELLKNLNWDINDYYEAYFIKLEGGLFKYREMFVHGNRFILDNPQYLFSVLNKNHLIIIINKTKLNKEKIHEEILDFIRKYKLDYYSHNLKNNLLDLNKAYSLAKYIFENEVGLQSNGQNNLHKLFYSRIGNLDFLNILIPDELGPLLEHDLEKNSEFLQTLYLYLLEERSLIKVAEIMDIHRNSVVYRINRISELVDIDFEDLKVRYNLLIGLEILKELYPKLITL